MNRRLVGQGAPGGPQRRAGFAQLLRQMIAPPNPPAGHDPDLLSEEMDDMPQQHPIRMHNIENIMCFHGGHPDFVHIEARIDRISKDIVYKACLVCKEKLINEDAHYRCKNCNSTSSRFLWRYRAQIILFDDSGSISVRVSEDFGRALFGRHAGQIGWLSENDEHAYNRKKENVLFNFYVWRLHLEVDEYNAMNVKYTVAGTPEKMF